MTMMIMKMIFLKRLPAFTLTEVIIVMAVSSVIIAAAVTFIVIIGKSGEDNLSDYNFNADALTVISILDREFRKAETISVKEEDSLILGFSNGEVLVLTLIPGTGIILSGQKSDTLKIDLISWSFGLIPGGINLVDGVRLEIANGRNYMMLVSVKNNARAALFNAMKHEDRYYPYYWY